jgi:hypothetical protein
VAAAAGTSASAQVYVDTGADIGPEPACPYGYYEYAPYPCAPYGYYGAEWFTGGLFIGAGPWFRGPRGFRGHVDPRFDPRRGYARPLPQLHERPAPGTRFDNIPGFHGDEWHDGRGNPRTR